MVSPPPPMPRRRRPLLLLLLLHLLIATAAASQSSALTQFKLSITSDPGGLLSLWSGPHPCSFPGITCDSTSHIIALNIPCPDPTRRLAGTLSPALASLASLQTLSLPFHNLHGEIPREIWLLKNLSIINLEGNSLSSSLPPHFPIGLTTLNLASNFIHGEIPQSLFSSLKLETLNLSVNQLNGTIPAKLDLPKLRRLSLSFNRIGGMIPDGIGSGCRSLEHLDLSGNLLVGSLPSSLGNCSELESLVLFSNLLGDTIPTDLGRLSKLRVLDVSRNAISGLVPAELGNCRELSVLVLMNFFDPMPGGDFSIYEGSDEFNCFQGGLPDNITALPKLRVLWAPRAMVEGDIPSNWGSCESLEMVNLGQNLLTGQIPKAFAGCKNLKFLNLSSNQLIGWLDEELPVPCMDVFDVSGNQLTGSIPRFNYGGCSRSPFPADDLASTYYSFFAYKTWTGTSLPYFGPDDDHAVYHNFGRNNLTGSLPALPIEVNRFGNNQTVYAFLADGNHLVGSLNGGLFEKCKDFNGLIFNLSNNMLSGGIPAEIGTLCRSLLVLDVSGNRITGDLPQSFGSRSSLVSLDLSRNGLQGHIPPNLERLKNLRYLLLASNNLIGQIPDELGHLQSLSVLDLSSNSLTGEIPTGLLNLRNLTVLILSNNKLSGMIPSAFANVTSLSTFNVSFNNLSGPLPSNASMMGCESVIGNPLLQSCYVYALSIPPAYLQGRSGDPQTSSDSSDSSDPPPESPPSNSGSSGFSSIEIASITSAAAIVSVLLALVLLYIYTRKCSPRSSSRPPGRREVIVFVDIGVPITYESVVRATGSFNASNCIGSGGFGATYKAEISPGVLVAIKRLSIGRFQGVQQFHAEIKTLGRCRHVNLVTLIGYHLSEAEMFLIYNYLPGGNLERFIQERSKRAVDWRMLHKIALDVARALTFLHDQCVPRILHRDVKPSNILLDNDYKAYLSDFGLARLLGNSETHVTTGVAGTFGYVAPEYAMTCRVSDKADVYSYGVVLLELISDKKVLDPSFSPYGNGFNIVTWASMMLSQGRAREFFTQGLWDVGPHDDLVEILHLAVTCTDEIVSTRPPMKHVLRRLKELQPPAL